MDQHSSQLQEISEDVKDLRKGIGAVQLVMSERHGQFMLLKQTLDGFIDRMTVHCKIEDESRIDTDKRIVYLENDRLIRDSRREDTDRRNNRMMVVIGLMAPIVYGLARTVFTGLFELMKR